LRSASSTNIRRMPRAKLDFVHIDRRSGGERQSVGEAVEEGTGDFDHVVG
jgi:hypothetical protein